MTFRIKHLSIKELSKYDDAFKYFIEQNKYKDLIIIKKRGNDGNGKYIGTYRLGKFYFSINKSSFFLNNIQIPINTTIFFRNKRDAIFYRKVLNIFLWCIKEGKIKRVDTPLYNHMCPKLNDKSVKIEDVFDAVQARRMIDAYFDDRQEQRMSNNNNNNNILVIYSILLLLLINYLIFM